MAPPIRILTAVPICDGHDSAINTINLEFIRHGIEVIYLGYHRSVGDIVRAAIQEDVRAIGISSYNGGHVEFFAEVIDLLRKRGATGIKVFGGGGGTITHDDAAAMKRKGINKIFFAGTSLMEMTDYVRKHYGKPCKRTAARSPDMELARKLTEIEEAYAKGKRRTAKQIRNPQSAIRNSKVIGFTGPGGAGKTTLIDELVLRVLNQNPKARIAILSHDPSVIGQGALLGDRATMINSQNDRVFMRSMATRGQAGGLSPATHDCLAHLNCRLYRAGNESRLWQPVAIAKDRHARSRRRRRGEQKRSATRSHRAHRDRTASGTKPARTTAYRYGCKTPSGPWRG